MTHDPEWNKTLLRRFFLDFWNQRRTEVLDEIFAPVSTLHLGGTPHTHSVEEWKHVLGHWWEAFPDLHFTIDALIAEGDRAVARVTYRGANRGAFWAMPATGRPIAVTEMLMVRVAGGKMVEAWEEFDEVGQMRQLGLLPEPGHDAAR